MLRSVAVRPAARIAAAALVASALAATGAALTPAQARSGAAASGVAAAGSAPSSAVGVRVAAAALAKGLSVTVAGIPTSVRAKVVVTGPKQSAKAKKKYSKTLTRSTLLKKLAPGTYKVTAAKVVLSTGTWMPSPTTKSYKVKSKKLTKATVTYRFTAKPAPPRTLLWDHIVSPAPLKATVTPDAGRTVSALIPRSGGTLTATGADGVTYTLTVPAGALLFDTNISMSPLAGQLGVPALGETSYGVKLGPEGQQFQKLVTLRITPAAGMFWPLKNQVPVDVQGAQSTVGLVPVDTTSLDPVLELMHFSSYAVLLSSKGYEASVAPVRKQIGGDAEQRINSAIAEKFATERVNQLLGSGGDLPAGFILGQYLKDYYDNVLKPRMAAAATSCAAGRLALQTLLGLERQMQLLGGSLKDALGIDPLPLIVGSFGDTVTIQCLKEEYEICRDAHVVTRMMPLIIGALRQEQLLGGSDEATPSARHQAMFTYARKCLSFEVQMDMHVTVTPVQPPGYPAHVTKETMTSRVKLQYGGTTESIPPEDIPTQYLITSAFIQSQETLVPSTAYTVGYSERCFQESALQRIGGLAYGTFGFIPKSASDTDPDATSKVDDFLFGVAFGPNSQGQTSNYTLTQRQQNAIGCGDVVSTTQENEGWITNWYSYLANNYFDIRGGIVIRDWQKVGDGNGDIMATKHIAGVETDNSLDADGSIDLVLFHTPAPN